MSQVIAFSDFDKYLSEIQKNPNYLPGTILDTNIFISLTYDVKNNHEEISDFLDSKISANEIRCFTTVNTRSEYLDFYRRLIMTENLRDVIDSTSKIRMTKKAKAVASSVFGRLSQRVRRGGDPVFTDSDLKEIKKAFSAGPHSGSSGWLEICNVFLGNKLNAIEDALFELGVTYLSQHNQVQKDLFCRKIEWKSASQISETSCLSLPDSMILNTFQCSWFSFMISTDFDMGYAVLANDTLKDVIMPDKIVNEYKKYNFSSILLQK